MHQVCPLSTTTLMARRCAARAVVTYRSESHASHASLPQIQTMNFRDVTPYLSVPAGRINIAIRPNGASSSSAPLATADLTVAMGKFYTAGFLGNVAGPVGQRVYSRVPIIVNEDVRTKPNPGRFNGLWYRWRYVSTFSLYSVVPARTSLDRGRHTYTHLHVPPSCCSSETNLVIDFRTVAGDPAPPSNVTTAPDAERITNLAPKTVIPISELPSGIAYSFYPCGVGSNAPLANPRLTSTGGFVAVRNLLTREGSVYDFFATGDTLLNAHDYNLQVTYTETPLTFDAVSGCTLAGAAGASFARAPSTSNTGDSDTVTRIDRVTIATLTLLCVSTVILVLLLVIAFSSRVHAPQAAVKTEFAKSAAVPAV